jgi:DNA polymerase III epsilon subunit-like protein
MTTIVVYDLEFTSWPDSLTYWWDAPGQYREVTQIGAVRYDTDQKKVIDRFNCLVRPVVNPQISDYNLNLIGHRQLDIDRADDLATVYPKFVDWAGDDMALAYGWDVLVLMETALLQNLKCSGTLDGQPVWLDLRKRDGSWPPSVGPAYHQQPAGTRTLKRYGDTRTREVEISGDPDAQLNATINRQLLRTANLRPWFAARGVPIDQYSSGQLHQYLGIPLDGHVHDALFDAMSLAVSYAAMLDQL